MMFKLLKWEKNEIARKQTSCTGMHRAMYSGGIIHYLLERSLKEWRGGCRWALVPVGSRRNRTKVRGNAEKIDTPMFDKNQIKEGHWSQLLQRFMKISLHSKSKI